MTQRRIWARAVALSTLCVTSVVGQAVQPRDVWYEYVDGNTRYGYRHVRVARQSDGTVRYRVETRVLINLFGQQKQEIVSTADYVANAALRPVSLRVKSRDLAGSSSVVGAVEAGRFVVRIQSAGEERKVDLEVEGEGQLVFAVSVPDFLRRQRADTKSIQVHEIEEDSWSLSSYRASRRGTHAWVLDPGVGFGVRTLTFRKDGVLQQASSEMPSSTMRLAQKADAENIVYRNMTGRELLTFPLDRPIRAIERLRKLSVRLSWKGIPLEGLHLVDARQRIASHDVKDGVHHVLLAIAEPAEIKKRVAIPVEDETLAGYLAETDFVKPKHPDIVAAARKAVGKETDALRAVHALCKFVQNHIQGKLVARTLSGPEVLACRSGKCSEYSTLFASLARAVGIPTRIALGERLLAGQWMGHMWNEAYVGRWVTVDATAGEVDRSFELLKFVHSDSVMGTQPVRWKLTKSLEIKVDSYELKPNELEAKFKTGVDGRTYTNTDHECQITAPGSAWTLEDKSSAAAVTVRFKRADAKGVFVHFVAFGVPEGTKAESIVRARLGIWKPQYTKLDIVEDKALKVAGASGHLLRHTGKPKGNAKLTNKATEVVWVRGRHGYLLNMLALEATHDAEIARFEQLLASFRFLRD